MEKTFLKTLKQNGIHATSHEEGDVFWRSSRRGAQDILASDVNKSQKHKDAIGSSRKDTLSWFFHKYVLKVTPTKIPGRVYKSHCKAPIPALAPPFVSHPIRLFHFTF